MIKQSLLLLAVGLASQAAYAETCEAPNPLNEYRLVFEEDFNGSSLDRGRWETEFLWGPGVIINNETQYYVNDNQFDYNPFNVSNGQLSIEAIKTPFDRSLLYLTRSIYSASTVELLWRVPSNAALYEVYRDGVLQGTSTGGSFLQSDLRDGIDYAYEVVAQDSNGNRLVAAQLTVNTADRPGAPQAPRLFSMDLSANVYSRRSAELTWAASNRAARYEVYRDGELHRSLEGGDYKSLYETGLDESQRYTYRVIAFDLCDEVIIEDSYTFSTADGVTPAAEQSERLVIKSTIFSTSTGEISWNSVQGASQYDIYDNGAFLKNTDGRSLFISDLVPGIDRKFLVVAFDSDGNEVDQTTRVLNTADNSFALNRQPFLSGIITSYESFKFKYGRVEVRAKMPAGKGLWSAVWLLNAYYKQDQPEDPEIDIMEAIGDRTTTGNHAYHDVRDNDGDGFYTDYTSTTFRSVIEDFSQDFHTYRVDWEEGRIVWYVDDIETGRVEGDQVSDEQMYLLANLAVGGDFPGPADETTPFPARLEIDYIRVYQR